MGTFEEQYGDVLQNIEFAVVGVNHEHPDLLDYHVDDALAALAAEYSAEQQGRAPRPVQLSEHRLRVYEAVKRMCEWRLGRGDAIVADAGEPPPTPSPKTLEEIVACLQRIRKSVRRWSKHGGRQGYLTFVQQYIV